MTMPASPFLSSDGRTDEAKAREVSGVVGGENREPLALRSQTGVGSERSSPSETYSGVPEAATSDEAAALVVSQPVASAAADISALLEIADSRFVLDVRAFMAAIEEVPLFLRRAG